MHYEIRRAHKTGRQLTLAQRSSPLFAEEPVVLGKVLRRGSAPRIIPADVFQQNRSMLLRQVAAGAIEIFEVDGDKSRPYSTTAPTEAQVAAVEDPPFEALMPKEEPTFTNPTVPPVPSDDMDAPQGETEMKAGLPEGYPMSDHGKFPGCCPEHDAEVVVAQPVPEDPEQVEKTPTPVVETKKKNKRN